MNIGPAAKKFFNKVQISFGIDANGVGVGGLDVDTQTVLEEAELFEALGEFELAGGQGGEAIQRGLAIRVEADVLPVLGDVPSRS